ncbi:flagellar export chaperone FliS [Mariprofundus sp. KV]|uniref:flagellar export chaperone FliS n=1 Tax=Mariprofundus sp. KV TaxID=2608715 RepID=UPI00159FBD15|nr:flagellar export chaperone FliS [Mariprofundus sp. KV]NWF37237.1 flagellar export chaperone FliS [Mariprofundus sp. KV]
MTGYKAYKGNQIEGAGPLGLVLLTYDALNRALGRARLAIEAGDFSQEGEHTGRAIEAVIELSSSLNMKEGGDVAIGLARLYVYMINTLTENMCSGSSKGVDEVMALARTLRDGWQELADQQEKKLSRPVARQQVSANAFQPAMAYGL